MNARTTLLAITLGVMILNCDDAPTGLTRHDPPAPPVHDPPAPPVVGVSSVLILQDSIITVTLGDTVRANVIVRDATGAVIADPQVVFLCQSAPVPPDARQGACLFDSITLDRKSFVFGSGTFMEGTVEVVARSGGRKSNTMYVLLAFGDPNNPWDY